MDHTEPVAQGLLIQESSGGGWDVFQGTICKNIVERLVVNSYDEVLAPQDKILYFV